MSPVLVVEDDRDTREMLALCLELEGFPVVTASNGMEGLERLKREGASLVLLDLMMPVMNGEQFREEQLRQPSLAHVPVVCISAMHDAPRRAAVLHVDACISKPFDLEQVLDVVRSQCGELAE